MKKLLYALVALATFISCDKDAHTMIYGDMMYFLTNETLGEGYREPVTQLTVNPQSRVDLLVVRNAFAAKDHPDQTVKIEVFEDLSTAKLGEDFTLDTQNLKFSGKGSVQLPLQMSISSGTSGKKIVLRLDYGYYDECSLEGRNADQLEINIE